MEFPFNRASSRDFLLRKSEALKSSVTSGASGVRSGLFGGITQMQTKLDQLSSKFSTSLEEDEAQSEAKAREAAQSEGKAQSAQRNEEEGLKGTGQENQCDQSRRPSNSSGKRRPPKPPLPKQLSRSSIDRGDAAALSQQSPSAARPPQIAATSNATQEINRGSATSQGADDVTARRADEARAVNSIISDARTSEAISSERSPRQPTDLLPGIPRNAQPSSTSLAAPSTDLLVITPTSGANQIGRAHV